jgi:glycosyltransferase involved in cell wall biosynthesis
MLSIIVSWRDRDEIAHSIKPMSECATALDGEVVIVNFGGDLHRLLRHVQGVHNTRVIDTGYQKYFNKGKAHNAGVAAANGDILFFCDCDILLERTDVQTIAECIEQESGLFGTIAGVRETLPNARGAGNVVCFGYELFIRIANGQELKIIDNEEDTAEGTRQAPGLLFVKRPDFLFINGYNGALHGWGWEDQDIIARLTLAAGLKRYSQGSALHISHGDDSRVAHYPVKDRWESRDRAFRQALANYDRGDFLGTYRCDIATLSLTEETSNSSGKIVT